MDMMVGILVVPVKIALNRSWMFQVGMRFLTERGQNVNGQPNIIYVSSDNGSTWMPLHEFVDVWVVFIILQ